MTKNLPVKETDCSSRSFYTLGKASLLRFGPSGEEALHENKSLLRGSEARVQCLTHNDEHS
jgi:hypothetical protein